MDCSQKESRQNSPIYELRLVLFLGMALGGFFLAPGSLRAEDVVVDQTASPTFSGEESQAAIQNAIALIEGQDGKRDTDGGLRLLRERSGAGDMAATAALGSILVDNYYVRGDAQEGLKLLQQSAAAGEPSSLLKLGEVLLWGGTVDADPDAARRYLLKAVSLGNRDAKRVLGEQLITGFVLEQDQAAGERLLLEAAATGDEAATVILGRLMFEGRSIPGRREEGKVMLEKSAASGRLDSLIALANGYLYGVGATPDPQRAKAYLEEAASKGSVDAKRTLGELLLTGNGKVADPLRGRFLLQELIEFDDPQAQRILGTYLVSSSASQAEVLKGEKLLEAATSADARAMVELGRRWLNESDDAAMMNRGKSMLLKATRRGQATAVEGIGATLVWSAKSESGRTAARELLVAAGNAGRNTAWLTLAQGASFSRLDVIGNSDYSTYAKKADPAGIELLEAQRTLWGLGGQAPNTEAALPLLEKAAIAGDKEALLLLLEVVRNGDGRALKGSASKARKLLAEHKLMLSPRELAREQLLLKASAASSLEHYEKFPLAMSSSGVTVDRNLLEAVFKSNNNLAVYLAQLKLQARGLYSGPLDGLATRATLTAMKQACSADAGKLDCGDEILSPETVAVIAGS